jgi:hypothetical protein
MYTRRQFGLAVLGLAIALLLGGAGVARAGFIIPFDPTGGAGANPGNVLNVASFSYLPGNVLLQNGNNVTPGGPKVGQDVTVFYQAILGSINTAGGNIASLAGNNGNISINGNPALNIQIVATAEFHETVASVVGNTVTYTPNFGSGANFYHLFAQPTTPGASVNDANFPTNQYGFGAQILSGHFVNPNNTFTSSLETSGSATVPLNQHTGGSGSYAGINSVIGSGSTDGALVMVDSFRPNYFLTAPGSHFSVNFTSFSSGAPFTAVDPALKMFDGTTAPNIGTINGSTTAAGGPDFLIQTQTTNDFSSAVPEPTSLTLLGAGAVGLLGYAWRRRRQQAT